MSERTQIVSRKKRVFVLLAAGFGCLQLFHPSLFNPPVTADFKANPELKAIIKRACYDCHSSETDLRWYDRIVPVYWQVEAHVKAGRESLNFSSWMEMTASDQKAKLWEMVNQIEAGAMPLKSYEFMHQQANLSKHELSVLKSYVQSMVVENRPGDTARLNAVARQIGQVQSPKPGFNKLPVALNGIGYIPDYKNWQVLSTTYRLDNNTMRVIFGNDIAVKAIRERKINHWPNGTILAKAAWEQLEDNEGNIRTGAFKQIEYMIKNDRKYATTLGWGFARFKTLRIQPYGKTAGFATECVSCHLPQKDNDFVFTQPIMHLSR